MKLDEIEGPIGRGFDSRVPAIRPVHLHLWYACARAEFACGVRVWRAHVGCMCSCRVCVHVFMWSARVASTWPQSPLARESCSRLCVYACARAECACGESAVCACMFACGVRVWRALCHKAL